MTSMRPVSNAPLAATLSHRPGSPSHAASTACIDQLDSWCWVCSTRGAMWPREVRGNGISGLSIADCGKELKQRRQS